MVKGRASGPLTTNKIIPVAGYSFKCKKTNKDGSKLLYCTERESGCKATCKRSSSGTLIVEVGHCHQPDQAKVEVYDFGNC